MDTEEQFNDLAGRLIELHEALETVNREVAATVKTARAEGKSWEWIGAQINLTKQGAQQRYGA